jgi:hypothetical protein
MCYSFLRIVWQTHLIESTDIDGLGEYQMLGLSNDKSRSSVNGYLKLINLDIFKPRFGIKIIFNHYLMFCE